MISSDVLNFFFTFLREQSGLVLDESRAYLIETRLEPLAVQEGFESIDALGRRMMSHPRRDLQQKVVDLMTTNETSFFRDLIPFQDLKEVVLPELVQANAALRRLRIWSAGCSTGQEPYSLAMILCEQGEVLKGWDVRILATDISEGVLKRAEEGVYSQYEVQRGLPIAYLTRFFRRDSSGWAVKPDIKKLVEFRKLNVLRDISGIGEVDVIFFRNVLIYFGQDTKRQVLQQMARILSSNGALFLGGAETPLGISEVFVRANGSKGVYYQKGQASVGYRPASAAVQGK